MAFFWRVPNRKNRRQHRFQAVTWLPQLVQKLITRGKTEFLGGHFFLGPMNSVTGESSDIVTSPVPGKPQMVGLVRGIGFPSNQSSQII